VLVYGFLTNHFFDVIEIVFEIQWDDVLPPVSVTWLARSLCVNIFPSELNRHWLVVWNMFYFFPFIGHNNPN